MLGIKPKADIVIRPPEFPEELRYLWHWFLEIIQGIDGNGWSQPVISWVALESWSRLTGQEIAARDAKVLVRLGFIRAHILSEKPKENGNKG